MTAHLASRRLFRVGVLSSSVLLFVVLAAFAQSVPASTFASPLSITPTPMPVPSALRGIHLGNRLNADWNAGLLNRIRSGEQHHIAASCGCLELSSLLSNP